MNRYKLQLFAEAVSGKKIVYMYRMLADAKKEAATHLAFTTENSISISRDADTTETKDGPIQLQEQKKLKLLPQHFWHRGM